MLHLRYTIPYDSILVLTSPLPADSSVMLVLYGISNGDSSTLLICSGMTCVVYWYCVPILKFYISSGYSVRITKSTWRACAY